VGRGEIGSHGPWVEVGLGGTSLGYVIISCDKAFGWLEIPCNLKAPGVCAT
jgi:hypothetical protein